MSNDARQRDTFLSMREIVREAARLCTAAEQKLSNGEGAGDTRVSAARKALRDKEQALVGTLEAFLDNAPEELLETRVQYMPVPRRNGQTGGPQDVAVRMVEINHQITRAIDDMAGKVESEDFAFQLEGLRRELATLARDTSMASVTMQDL